MKFTLAIAALASVATTALANREWTYNDSHRAAIMESLKEVTAKHAHLCKRWDGPRCVDDEDKPSPWEMNYLKRKTAKIEKQEAEDSVEKIRGLWKKWSADQKDMLSKVKKGGKAYMALLEEVSGDAEDGVDTDVKAVRGVRARCRGSC